MQMCKRPRVGSGPGRNANRNTRAKQQNERTNENASSKSKRGERGCGKRPERKNKTEIFSLRRAVSCPCYFENNNKNDDNNDDNSEEEEEEEEIQRQIKNQYNYHTNNMDMNDELVRVYIWLSLSARGVVLFPTLISMVMATLVPLHTHTHVMLWRAKEILKCYLLYRQRQKRVFKPQGK